MTNPTPAQLDTLAAWWQAGGSNTGAATILNLSSQVVRTTLMWFRRQEGVDSNLQLGLRYQGEIQGRVIRPRQRRQRVAV